MHSGALEETLVKRETEGRSVGIDGKDRKNQRARESLESFFFFFHATGDIFPFPIDIHFLFCSPISDRVVSFLRCGSMIAEDRHASISFRYILAGFKRCRIFTSSGGVVVSFHRVSTILVSRARAASVDAPMMKDR